MEHASQMVRLSQNGLRVIPEKRSGLKQPAVTFALENKRNSQIYIFWGQMNFNRKQKCLNNSTEDRNRTQVVLTE